MLGWPGYLSLAPALPDAPLPRHCCASQLRLGLQLRLRLHVSSSGWLLDEALNQEHLRFFRR